MKIRSLFAIAVCSAALMPTPGFAWGAHGHILVAAIARARLSPATLAKVDAWRGAGHRETAEWHFVDIELDHPDMDAACYNHPPSAVPASAGPEKACIVDRVAAFATELGAPGTPPAERILALKYVLHLVGDLHQPLHAADNHDHGGNCVPLALGGPRTVNLHSYWDTVVVGELGPDTRSILAKLQAEMTPDRAAAWSKGDFTAWAKEANAVAVRTAYSFRTPPRCESNAVPLDLPAAYDAAARTAASLQLEKAGVRLEVVLEGALGPLSLSRLAPAPAG